MIYLLWFAIIWLLCALLSFCCSISKLTKQTNHSFEFHFKIPFSPPSLLRLLLYLGYSSASFCDCNSLFPPFPGSLTSLLHFFSATRHRILFTASLLLYVRFPFDRCRCCFGLLMDDLCLCWRHHRLLFLLLCYWSLFNWLIFLYLIVIFLSIWQLCLTCHRFVTCCIAYRHTIDRNQQLYLAHTHTQYIRACNFYFN